jgi:O-acetylserine/cysteine efflux transporter
MRITDILLAIIVTLIWGINFVATKYGLYHFPPIFLMGLRFAVVAIVLVPFVPRPNIPFKHLYFASLTQIVGYHALLFTAVWKGTDISTSAITIQLNVPITAILGVYFLKDKLHWRRITGMIIAFMGIVLVVGSPDVVENKNGFWLLVASAACWAIFNVHLKMLGSIKVLPLMAWSSLISIPHLFILSYIFEPINKEMMHVIPMSAIYSVLYMSLLSTIVGFGIWFYLLKRHPVNQVAPFSLLVPVFGIISAVICLGETLTWQIATGGIITLIGVAIIVIRRPQVVAEGSALN